MAAPTRLTKTLLYSLLEAQATSNVDYRYFVNTTLNSKYNVRETDLPADGEKPTLNYFGIGITGFRNLDEGTLSAPLEPRSDHMDIFTPLPFRVRPINDDLSESERAKYRIRVKISLPGLGEFWAYYLKKIVYENDSVKIVETDDTTGVETIIDELDISRLNPDPAEASTTEEGLQSTGKSRSVIKDGVITITGEEVVEAIQYLYGGNLLRARISELGFYSGVDKNVPGESYSDGGVEGSINYIEAIYAQLAFHYTSTGSDFSDATKVSNQRLRTSSAESFLI